MNLPPCRWPHDHGPASQGPRPRRALGPREFWPTSSFRRPSFPCARERRSPSLQDSARSFPPGHRLTMREHVASPPARDGTANFRNFPGRGRARLAPEVDHQGRRLGATRMQHDAPLHVASCARVCGVRKPLRWHGFSPRWRSDRRFRPKTAGFGAKVTHRCVTCGASAPVDHFLHPRIFTRNSLGAHVRRASPAAHTAIPGVRIPSAPPVSPSWTFFSLRSRPAGTPQDAGLSAHLFEPRGRAPRPIMAHIPSLFVPFL